MKARLLAISALLALAGAAHAQQTPFDMSPERPQQEPVPPALAPQAPVPDTAPQAAAPAPSFDRFILGRSRVPLAGEISTSGRAIYLTSEQAASPARLHLGYQNAVVVAPENSRLVVTINGVPVMQEQISASEGTKRIEAEVPAGILRPGRNEISLAARQRHRTDCTIQSTYELWTEVEGAATYLAFSDPQAGVMTRLEDLRALGLDSEGRLRVRIVAPGLARTDIGADIVRLSQAIALSSNAPDIEFEVVATSGTADVQPGLTVLVGTTSELEQVSESIPAAASEGPYAAFIEWPGAMPVLAVTGAERADWRAAIDRLLANVDRPAGTVREMLVTESWRTPNAPMLPGGASVPLSALGLESQQFTGRSYRTEFQFAVPADFYADAYGQARLLLDLAYSDAVEPGSLLNVYVNGSLAASTPITTRRGAVLNQFPVRMPMHHFKPGLNTIVLEANLLSEEDTVCAPGTPGGSAPRFAIFDTSRFDMPAFARIGQMPNLAALAGTAFPYLTASAPIPLVMNRGESDVLSAAATFMARLSLAAGRAIPVEFTASAETAIDRNAIIIGAINDIQQVVLTQVGISEDSRTLWAPVRDDGTSSPPPADTSLDEWRSIVEGQGWRSWASSIEDWIGSTFNITIDMLRFVPPEEAEYRPAPSDMLVLAQAANPARNGVWTLVTAPDDQMLREGVAEFTDQARWAGLEGHLASFDSATGRVATLPVSGFTFIETQPRSLSNYRLIAANWLSANILSYSLLLVVACIVLGIATSALLSRLGRDR